jgi:ABC-type glycerol-3-phosphate transport system permease component
MTQLRRPQWRTLWPALWIHLATVVVAAIFVFPFYWMVLISIRDLPAQPDIKLLPPLQNLTLKNYATVFRETLFPLWFWNSLVVAVATTLVAMLFSIFTGYALSRFRFLGRRPFATGILLTQMLPGVLLAIPLYVILRGYRLDNTYPGLVLVYLTIALPFCTWMLWGYFDSISSDLEEAAMVDGCTHTGALFRVILPLAAPGVAAVAIFAFVLSWQEYLYALLIMNSERMQLLTVGASRISGHERIVWGEMMAYAVMVTLPVVLLFIFAQRYVVQGLTAGAVKG